MRFLSFGPSYIIRASGFLQGLHKLFEGFPQVLGLRRSLTGMLWDGAGLVLVV